MNRTVVQNICLTIVHDFSCFVWIFFLKQKSDNSITVRTSFQYVERQFGNKIEHIHRDNRGEYISNKLEDIFLMSAVFQELTLPFSPESNGIRERFYQIINTIVRSMIIPSPDFPCL
jgi:transposase InsO family protein